MLQSKLDNKVQFFLKSPNVILCSELSVIFIGFVLAKDVSKKKKSQPVDKQQTKNVGKKRSWKRKIMLFLLKIFLVIVAITVVYGIYLDQQIKKRIDGNVWELPAAVYGRIIDLEPYEHYNAEEITAILKNSQYRQVIAATRPGEFVVHSDSIELFRRAFTFPDGDEDAFRAKIYFNQGKISLIKNLDSGRGLGLLRIDPKLITMMHSPNGEQRLFVPLKNFSDSLIQTLVATEDKRFYEHDGVSVYSILRAIYTNLISGKTLQGGSTLTQQLVKNLFLTNERSYIRKIREAYMAIILDSRYSKERILELYLNEVYLGQSGSEEIHGFPLASFYYFGRTVNELTLDQQALLVGIVKGASYYNPWTRAERAKNRRNVVLKLMEEQKIIDTELYRLLSERPLAVLPKGGVITPQPAFMQLVRQSLKEQLGNQATQLSGMKIFTTFDPRAQSAIEKAVTDEIKQLKNTTGLAELQTAVVIADRETGEVRAIVGSDEPHYPGFNRALYARRPIGSLAKPPTYLTALSQPEKYHLNTILDDKPLSIQLDSRTLWKPQNYDKKYRNSVTLLDALTHSLNIPSVNLGMAVGLEASKKTLLALGVPNSQIKPVPSRFLGSLELTPLETAQMYQAITNNGQKATLNALRYVLSEHGELIYQRYPNTQQVVAAQAAYLTTFAMQKVTENGTARSLNHTFPTVNLATKTGTTNDLKDSWIVGADDKEVTVIWVGLDNHKPMKLTGSSGALKIYQTYLAYNSPLRLQPKVPSNIHYIGIDEKGHWLCQNSDTKTLPAWTMNSALLCAGFNSVPQEKLENDAPNWLKEMFGIE